MLEEQCWDLINDRELVQLHQPIWTSSPLEEWFNWYLLIPTSERKNIKFYWLNNKKFLPCIYIPTNVSFLSYLSKTSFACSSLFYTNVDLLFKIPNYVPINSGLKLSISTCNHQDSPPPSASELFLVRMEFILQLSEFFL